MPRRVNAPAVFLCGNEKWKNGNSCLLSEAANLDVFFFLDFGHFLVLLET